MFELSIVIPTVGRVEILNRTLAALKKATEGFHVEVIVVDDSTGGVVSLHPPLGFILHRSGGKGASTARNTGWREAKSDLILFLDDDMLIEAHHIKRTLELHAESGNKAYNFFWLYPPDLMNQLNETKFGKYILKHRLYSNAHRLPDYKPNKKGFEKMEGLTSQYFSIEKKWLEVVNGYDTIPFAGVEDMLLYKKLNEIGVEVHLSFDEVVYQNESNRLQVSSVVNRYRTGALTRRLAVEMGHPEMGVRMSPFQKIIGGLAWIIEPVVKGAMFLPYGPIYEKAVNTQLFFATYRGYYVDRLPGQKAE